jgi:hypothetical protein
MMQRKVGNTAHFQIQLLGRWGEETPKPQAQDKTGRPDDSKPTVLMSLKSNLGIWYASDSPCVVGQH